MSTREPFELEARSLHHSQQMSTREPFEHVRPLLGPRATRFKTWPHLSVGTVPCFMAVWGGCGQVIGDQRLSDGKFLRIKRRGYTTKQVHTSGTGNTERPQWKCTSNFSFCYISLGCDEERGVFLYQLLLKLKVTRDVYKHVQEFRATQGDQERIQTCPGSQSSSRLPGTYKNMSRNSEQHKMTRDVCKHVQEVRATQDDQGHIQTCPGSQSNSRKFR